MAAKNEERSKRRLWKERDQLRVTPVEFVYEHYGTSIAAGEFSHYLISADKTVIFIRRSYNTNGVIAFQEK